MLERIMVRRHRTPPTAEPVDMGALVEAMLFYGETKLVLDGDVLRQLARKWTPEGLIELSSSGFIRFVLTDNHAAIHTADAGTQQERYSPVVYTIHASEVGPSIGMERFVPAAFEEITGRRGHARRLAARFGREVTYEHVDSTITARSMADILDQLFLERAVRDLLALYVPEYPALDKVRFEAADAGNGLAVETNIDFRLANRLYHQSVPVEHSSITPALLLAFIVSGREALETAAEANAEMALDPSNALVSARRADMTLGLCTEADALVAFQDFVFDDGKAIREAVNSGARSIDDVLSLLRKARRFREWLHVEGAREDLLKEYFRASTEDTWVERLPVKIYRWLLFTGIGIGLDVNGAGGLGTASAAAVGAADTFLLDRLLRGWRPSQFVEGRLRPFVRNK